MFTLINARQAAQHVGHPAERFRHRTRKVRAKQYPHVRGPRTPQKEHWSAPPYRCTVMHKRGKPGGSAPRVESLAKCLGCSSRVRISRSMTVRQITHTGNRTHEPHRLTPLLFIFLLCVNQTKSNGRQTETDKTSHGILRRLSLTFHTRIV